MRLWPLVGELPPRAAVATDTLGDQRVNDPDHPMVDASTAGPCGSVRPGLRIGHLVQHNLLIQELDDLSAKYFGLGSEPEVHA